MSLPDLSPEVGYVPSNAHDVAGLIAQDRATSDEFDRMTRCHGYERAALIWNNGCELFDSWHAEDEAAGSQPYAATERDDQAGSG